jgi:hypothetical protein
MSISATDTRLVEPGEAPFIPGDRVIYRPRPAGIETVELVEYRGEGWGGWYVLTRRRTDAHCYDRAEFFDGGRALDVVMRSPGLGAGNGGSASHPGPTPIAPRAVERSHF